MSSTNSVANLEKLYDELDQLDDYFEFNQADVEEDIDNDIFGKRRSPVNSFDQRSFSSRITAPTSILNDSETRSITSIVSKTPNWNEQPGFILTPFFSNKSRRSSGTQSKSNLESNSSLTLENNNSKESSN